jgi:nicotinamidase-related amidase
MIKPFTLLQLSGKTKLNLDLTECIIVTIDAQEEYRSGLLPLVNIDSAIQEGKQLLEKARALSTKIVHVVHINDSGAKTFAEDSITSKIFPEYKVRDNEIIVKKKLPNSFAGTNLKEVIQASGKKQIILWGFMTHMCLSTTARAAVDLGYISYIVERACATRDLPGIYGGTIPAKQVHETALAELADRFAFIISDSSELINIKKENQ